MPRKQGKTVPEGTGPVPHHDEYVPHPPKMTAKCRLVEVRFVRQLDLINNNFDQEDKKSWTSSRRRRQRFAGLEHDARQPRLAMKADVKLDTKTRKRMDGAAANRAKHSSSTKKVDASPMSSTSFGMIAEPPALPCRDGTLDDKSTEAPKPCLSHVEMRTLTVAGGILPAGTDFSAMRAIFHQPPF